jgi:hypothetical protein
MGLACWAGLDWRHGEVRTRYKIREVARSGSILGGQEGDIGEMSKAFDSWTYSPWETDKL